MKKIRTIVFIIIFVSLFLLAQEVKISASTTFFDNFSDVNGTTLNVHNSIWECDNNSDAIIQDDKLIKSSGIDTQICLANSFKDGTVSAEFTFFGSSSYYSGAVFLRYQDNNNYYQCNVNANDGYVIFKVVDNNFIILKLIADKPGPGNHIISCSAIGSELKLLVDGIEKIQVNDSEFQNIGKTGIQLRANNTIDNFKSSPASVDILVPLWKQTDLNWKNQIYDHAERWNPRDPSIGSWGCALTSAAMVLNYYNIVKLPDTSFLTPSSLNRWLNSQKDGYVRNGQVNWLAISRLTKIAKASGLNPDFDYDALEFNRQGSNSKDLLKDDLMNNQPDILQVPGHFIVAKGTQDNTFLINDPFYDYDSLDQSYSNSYISLNRFIPSNTDLSYIFAVGDDNLTLQLKNNNGEEVGEAFQQNPIKNPTDPTQQNNPRLNQLLYQNPNTGRYSFEIIGNSTSEYRLDLFAYDQNGNPEIKLIEGIIGKGKKEVFTVNFDKDNASNSAFTRYVTISTLEDDIQEAIDLKLLNKTLGKNLLKQAKTVTLLSTKKNSSLQIDTRLKQIQRVLDATKGKLIQNDAYIVLSNDITSLLSAF